MPMQRRVRLQKRQPLNGMQQQPDRQQIKPQPKLRQKKIQRRQLM
jgi:hypothetical protein